MLDNQNASVRFLEETVRAACPSISKRIYRLLLDAQPLSLSVVARWLFSHFQIYQRIVQWLCASCESSEKTFAQGFSLFQ